MTEVLSSRVLDHFQILSIVDSVELIANFLVLISDFRGDIGSYFPIREARGLSFFKLI